MTFIRLIVGAVILIAGRQLYWFFVAAAGFVAGLDLATRFLKGESELVILIIALTAGFIGAVLAMFIQRIAVAVAGFILGGFALTAVLDLLNLSTGRPIWIFYLLAGVIGAVLVSVFFDWALILLSALTGAALIVPLLEISLPLQILAFLGVNIFWLKDRQRLARGPLYGGGLTIAFVAVVALLYIAMGFGDLWYRFHLVFFTNDFWSAEGYMLRLFPQSFFADAAIFCGLFAVAGALICGGAGWWIKRKSESP